MKSHAAATAGIQVTGIEVTDIVIKPPAKFAHLMQPEAFPLTQQKCSFDISGVNNAQANAIRRTLMGELPVVALACDYESIVTDDPHVIGDMIQRRLRSIPLLQSAPSKVYSLEFHNTTLIPQDVKSVLIKDQNGVTAPINHTYTLLTVAPGKRIKISNITHFTERGFVEGNGMHVLTWRATSIAIDIEPLNEYTGKGTASHIAAPREWRISFGTNGTMPAREIVKMACEDIAERIDAVSALLGKIRSDDTKYTLDIPGESNTVGNLLMCAANDLFPGLSSVVFDVPTTERHCVFKVDYDDDINTFFSSIIEREVAVFKRIAQAFA